MSGMEDPLAWWDELGPAKTVYLSEPGVDLRAVVAIDNVACGPSIGGVRMATDATAHEAVRLARAMTLKNAAAGLPHGGGKSVILADAKASPDQKEARVRAFACAIRELTDYIPGPDMGTDEACMGWIHDEIGRAVGLPREIGGIPLDELGATGFGLAACAEVAQEFAGFELSGARVAVQGFGNVGRHVARFLAERGALLVAASDSQGTIAEPGGLDVGELIAVKAAGGSVLDAGGGERGAIDAVIDVECDIWIPSARPDVIHEDNVDRLQARLVLQGANIPITPGAETILHERGVLNLPDFVANAGGVICASVEYAGGSPSQAFETIEEKIKANTRSVLEGSKATGATPRHVAVGLAEGRIRRAAGLRRFRAGRPEGGFALDL